MGSRGRGGEGRRLGTPPRPTNVGLHAYGEVNETRVNTYSISTRRNEGTRSQPRDGHCKLLHLGCRGCVGMVGPHCLRGAVVLKDPRAFGGQAHRIGSDNPRDVAPFALRKSSPEMRHRFQADAALCGDVDAVQFEHGRAECLRAFARDQNIHPRHTCTRQHTELRSGTPANKLNEIVVQLAVSQTTAGLPAHTQINRNRAWKEQSFESYGCAPSVPDSVPARAPTLSR